MEFINSITIWHNYTFKISRKFDALTIAFSYSFNISVTGRVKTITDLVRTNFAKEAINL